MMSTPLTSLQASTGGGWVWSATTVTTRLVGNSVQNKSKTNQVIEVTLVKFSLHSGNEMPSAFFNL